MTYSKEEFCKIFADEILAGTATFFIGAGLSAAAGFVDWKGMMRGIAEQLELDVEREPDLVAIAQYHLNGCNMDRTRLNEILVAEFIRDAQPTENHELIANLPIDTVWTTNYDHLIEKAFENLGKRVDKKYHRDHFSRSLRGRDIILYKMHGDAECPDDVVITKEDYESYEVQREFFMRHLQGDLISKTFLFLGFNFTDPNIDYVLGRLRLLFGRIQRPHYWIVRRPSSPDPDTPEAAYELRKFQYRIKDLERYGIHAIEVEDHAELTSILQSIQRHVARRSVYIASAGSSACAGSQGSAPQLAAALGEALIHSGYNIVSPMSPGLGDQLITGAVRACLKSPGQKVAERILFRPLPAVTGRSGTAAGVMQPYKRALIASCGSALFINAEGDGWPAESQNELDLSLELGRIPVPALTAQAVARRIWARIQEHPSKLTWPHEAQGLYERLAQTDLSVAARVEAVMHLLGLGQRTLSQTE